MITAPFSPSASPTTSWNCSMALPIQAKTSETPSFLSAINPSSETERPNITFPIMFSFRLALNFYRTPHTQAHQCQALTLANVGSRQRISQLLHILNQVSPGYGHPFRHTYVNSHFQ